MLRVRNSRQITFELYSSNFRWQLLALMVPSLLINMITLLSFTRCLIMYCLTQFNFVWQINTRGSILFALRQVVLIWCGLVILLFMCNLSMNFLMNFIVPTFSLTLRYQWKLALPISVWQFIQMIFLSINLWHPTWWSTS